MTNLLHCDLCVLGGGGSGLAAARTAAALGAKVILVEKRALGGAYLTQVLPAQAFCTHALQPPDGRPFDPAAGRTRDFVAFRARVLAAIKVFARDFAPNALPAANIEVIRDIGSFSRPTRLEAGGYAIEAKYFILAPGTLPTPAPLPGQELIRPLRIEDLLTLERPPDDLVIVGASFLGLTLAQAFLRLGTRVTLVESRAILPSEDPELVAPILTQLARDGLRLHSHADISGIEPRNGGVRVQIKGLATPLDAAHLCLAGAPPPLVEGLGLRNAGVTYANSGILTDANGRTSNRRIYAVGSAAGGPETALAALGQAARVARRLFSPMKGALPPARLLSTSPAMAVVGLTEAQAREKHRDIRVLRAPFGMTAGARLSGTPDGHVKIVTNAAGSILGAGITGAQAGEIIGIFALAIGKAIKAADLDVIANAPVLAEAVSNAALASPPQLGKGLEWRAFLPRRAR
jgi:pyruvate/2-oxoglutarate dehydrogenase complex dihydrolipoamide dehydrogenase (E3) component